MKGKVLITDKVHNVLIEGLSRLNYQLMYEPEFDPNQLPELIPELTGIIINSKIKMTKAKIDLATQLKFIGRLGSGLEIIDVEYAKEKGIHVWNSPEGNRNAVAEHALGMLLCLLNKLIKADTEIRNKTWKREENRGEELSGKTIGVIGFGNTGKSFVRKLSGWALDIIYYDPYVLETKSEFKYICKVGLEELKTKSDVISLHVPLTDETKWMIDENFLNQCKDQLILVNTSRGSVIDTSDLIDALKKGKLKGACLDVFENEKPHHFTFEEDQLYNELYTMDNTVLSPHIAGWTKESLYKIGDILLSKISSIS